MLIFNDSWLYSEMIQDTIMSDALSSVPTLSGFYMCTDILFLPK